MNGQERRKQTTAAPRFSRKYSALRLGRGKRSPLSLKKKKKRPQYRVQAILLLGSLSCPAGPSWSAPLGEVLCAMPGYLIIFPSLNSPLLLPVTLKDPCVISGDG